MAECIMSSILTDKIKKNERVRIQTQTRSVYEGKLSATDCMGVLFIPSDKTLDPAYILYSDVKKFMLPEHDQEVK